MAKARNRRPVIEQLFSGSKDQGGKCSAKGLYKKLGFQIMATRPKYFMDTGEDALIMIKVLEETQ